MKISDLQTKKNLALLQTGEAGAGKTHRAISAIRFGKLLMIDTDRKFAGMVPRLRLAYGATEVDSKIEVEVTDTASAFKALMERLPTLAKDFATVVLDTQSRAFDLVIADVKAINPKGDGRQIFGAALELNLRYLNIMLSLPCNKIINAHVGGEEQADGTTKLTSTTPGKFGKKMTEFFNEVHYCYLNAENKHSVRGEPSALVVARTVLPKSALTANGIFLKDDLSIFDETAYRQ